MLDIADALEANEKLISAENEADVAEAQQTGYEKALVSRLALKPGKARHHCMIFLRTISIALITHLLNYLH